MGIFGNKRQQKYDFEVPSMLEPCGDRVAMPGSFPRKFKGCMSEVEWRRIRFAIDEVVNGEQTHPVRTALARAHRRILFCMLLLVIGFMAGFICSFLGASFGTGLVLGLGIMFVGIFIGSLIIMIRTSFLINALKASYIDLTFNILNVETIPRLQAEHPMLYFEMVSIGRKGRICSIRVRPARGLASYTSVSTGVATIYSPVTAAPVPSAPMAPYLQSPQHQQQQLHEENLAMHYPPDTVVDAQAVPSYGDYDLKPNREYYSMAAHAV